MPPELCALIASINEFMFAYGLPLQNKKHPPFDSGCLEPILWRGRSSTEATRPKGVCRDAG